MGIGTALKSIPWTKLARLLAVGVAGELAGRGRQKDQADLLKLLEERQQETAEAVQLVTAQLKFVLWIAIAALVVAVAALVVAAL